MKIEHNSARCCYRFPLGAMRTGEQVTLRLLAEDPQIRSVRVKTFFYEDSTEYDMTRMDRFFVCDLLLPQSPGVLWYFFVISYADRTIYYGPPMGKTQGEGVIYDQPPASFQLTVYDASFQTPEWFRGTIMYQIFPDRFKRGDPKNLERGVAYHKSMGRKVVVHENWEEPVLYQSLEGEKYYSPCDFYGGDLRGIIDSIPYFQSLGVGVLYLNPIVEAASNHRYDTGNYKNVDPILGTPEDFKELCEKAEQAGIRVMIDGVYSHTGSDSLYFNKLGNYLSVGAYQSERSPYYSWYTFLGSRDSYQCWWGFDTLPEVNELNPVWQKDIITGSFSVFSYWKQLGAMGIRLDVADELPDSVIELMRSSLKEGNPDRVLLGEVWEDATTKQSYGTKRQYALGKGLDTVMNYPFKNAVLGFLNGYSTAKELQNFLLSQQLNYPQPMYHALMNLVSSHDEPRARTVLATGMNGEGLSREDQAEFAPTAEQERRGDALMRLAGVFQMTVPGTPSIYYGDECGMHGWKDPFNRQPFSVKDPELVAFFQSITAIRKTYPSLLRGRAAFVAPSDGVIGIARFISDQGDAFGKEGKQELLLTLISRSSEPVSTDVQLRSCVEGISKEDLAWFESIQFPQARVLCGKNISVCILPDRSIQAEMPPYSFCIIQLV